MGIIRQSKQTFRKFSATLWSRKEANAVKIAQMHGWLLHNPDVRLPRALRPRDQWEAVVERFNITMITKLADWALFRTKALGDDYRRCYRRWSKLRTNNPLVKWLMDDFERTFPQGRIRSYHKGIRQPNKWKGT